MIHDQRGVDAHQRANGRKWHCLADTDGRIVANLPYGVVGQVWLADTNSFDRHLKKVLSEFAEAIGEKGLLFERAARP